MKTGKAVENKNNNVSRMQTLSFVNGLDLHSFETVEIEDWHIRVSITNIDSILVVMQNPATFDCRIGCFFDELEANRFINFWLSSSTAE